MEENRKRRLLIAVGVVLLFTVVVLVWYFFFSDTKKDPTINTTKEPLVIGKPLKPRQNFIWDTPSSSSTEVFDPLKDPLIRIWDRPSSGQTFITDDVMKETTEDVVNGTTTIRVKKMVKATSTVVLFVDRTTGYVLGYPIETGQIFQISNTVIPGIYDAYFFDHGKKIIMRYIDQEKNTIVGVLANIPNVTQTGAALPLEKVQYLNSQVVSVAVRSDTEELSYVVSTDSGSAVYSVDKSSAPRLIASSPFKEWNLSYGGSKLYVTTKPSAYVQGMTLSLPLFQSEIVEKTGLMTLPSDNGLLLNSMWGKQGLATFFYAQGNSKVLSVKTLTKKCTWGNNDLLVCGVPRTLSKGSEGLPDDWFQGRVIFKDDLMIIDKNSGEAYPLYAFNSESPKEGDFDITSITVSEKNDLYSFSRKQDNSLWLLNTNLIQGE